MSRDAPRLNPLSTRGDLPESDQHHYDAIEESRGGVRGPFTMLLHSPEVAGLVGNLGHYIRFESTLPPVERELAIVTTAREFDCAYEWAAHARIAREVGVAEESINVIADREDPHTLPDPDALIVRYGRELFRHHQVHTDTYEAAHAHFGDQGVVELTATMGYYGMIACVLNAFDVRPPADAPQLPD